MPGAAIRLVIFDWAGTVVDHGSVAPIAALQRAFADLGVELNEAEARGPMGLHKRDHIKALLAMPAVRERWRRAIGKEPAASDADEIYEMFLPLQLAEAVRRTDLIPGVRKCCDALRQREIAIGTTTGYPRLIGERVAEAAREQGFVPDCSVFADEVPAARPAPWMIFRIMEATRVAPPSAVVKIGDTVPDIEEGLNAGAWPVGVADTGSEVGLDLAAWQAISEVERSRLSAVARQKLLRAGAHAVVKSLVEIPELINDLNARLSRGERP